MAAKALAPTHHDLPVPNPLSQTTVHYLSAGSPSNPTLLLLLLHGFPSSSTQYRDFIPLLFPPLPRPRPRLPGVRPHESALLFRSYVRQPRRRKSSLAESTWGCGGYAMCIFDYGAPIGFRLAPSNPNSIKAITSQNGNAFDSTFGPDFRAPILALWSSYKSPAAREILRTTVLTQGDDDLPI